MSNVVTDISKLDPKVLIGGMIAGPVIATAVAGVIAGIGGKLGSGIMGLFGTGGKAAAGALGVGGGAAAKGLTTMSMALKSVGLGAIKIVAGGGAIAAVILAIGGAIAGAAWLTGSTLPKLTSAMKGIEELDGDRLVSAAKGLTAVSAAMAVMGGGSAVGAIGGLVSKIVSGGDSPADMLTNMAGAVDDFADAIDKLDLAKMTMLAGFVVPGAGELAELVQDATGGGAAATSGTATNTTTSSSDSTALLQRLLDVQTRQGTETNDLLRRISNDI
jgi:hypothetical protein